MAFKGKGCHGKDVFSRMNFLYQASMLMANKSDVLSSYYGNLCKAVGKRAVLRMEPEIKRTLCKRCGIALKPNISANVFTHEQNEQIFVVECRKCGFRKHFNINSKYKLWLEDRKSIVETYNFENDVGEQIKTVSASEKDNEAQRHIKA